MDELRALIKNWPWVVLGLLVAVCLAWAWIWPESFSPWEGLVIFGLFVVAALVLAWRGKPEG